jgi:TonB family protein
MTFIRNQHPLLRFLLAISIVHLLFLISKYKPLANFKPAPLVVPKPVEMVELTAEQWQAKKTKQIVQSEESKNNSKPREEAFLSDKDRSFDRQTVARKVDTFRSQASQTITKKTVVSEKPQQNKKQAAGVKNLDFSKLGKMTLGEMGVDEHKLASPQESSSKQVLKTPGVSSTNDYVEEVKLGDFTQLNTVEYKYYGFFHRIKLKLEQFWGKSIREKAENLYRSGRSLASDQYVTSLIITLDQNGKIVKVQVRSSSGVKELDDAAIESFNKAGPFPNPPTGLLVNGKATIEWGFVVNS